MKSKHYPRGQDKEATLTVTDPSILKHLVGETGKTLKSIEKKLDIKMAHHGDVITASGIDSGVDLAIDLLDQLKGLLERGETLWDGDAERALEMLSKNRKLRLEELFRDQVKIAGRKHTIVPKTFAQKVYMEAIRTNDIVFGVGPAGTGKTYLAMALAISALLKKEVKRLVLCRPAVEAGEKLGFLPGDMAEKVNPYLRPLYDALHDMVESDRAQEMVQKGQIEVAPLAFMRGRTLTNAFVILDEAQNTTPVQMKMFLTRLGYNSKGFVTGDPSQIDLPRGTPSGLIDAMATLKNVEGLAFVNFQKQDVIRHPLVMRIVEAYEKKEARE